MTLKVTNSDYTDGEDRTCFVVYSANRIVASVLINKEDTEFRFHPNATEREVKLYQLMLERRVEEFRRFMER